MARCKSCGRSVDSKAELCFHCDKYFGFNKKGLLFFKDTNELAHRFVAEKKLVRKLNKEDVVHHFDQKANDMDSLFVFKNQVEHDRIHKHDAFKFGKRVDEAFKKKLQWSKFFKKKLKF